MSLMFGMSQADKHGTEHRKDVSLDEGYKELQTIQEENHDKAEYGKTRAKCRIERPSDEDDGCKRQDNGVACHHVSKETDHQGEGLGDDAKDLDDRHDSNGISLQERWYIGPEYLLPVLLVAKEVDGQHRAERQEEGDIDIARHVSTTREDGQEAQHVGDQNEEECRQQIGCIGAVVLLADRVFDEVVVDRHHQHLYHAYKALGHILGGIVLLIPTGTAEEDGQHDGYDNPYLQHTLGDAEIPRTNTRTVGKALVDLAVLLLVEVEAHVVAPLFHRLLNARTAEGMPLTGGLAPDDNGQRNADVMASYGGDMPLIGIGEVAKHNLLHVYPFTLAGRHWCADGKKKG